MTEDELNEFVASLAPEEFLALSAGTPPLSLEAGLSLFEKGVYSTRPPWFAPPMLTELGRRAERAVLEVAAFHTAIKAPFMLKGDHAELLFKCHGLKPGMAVTLSPSGDNIMQAGPGSVVIGHVAPSEEGGGKWRVIPVKLPMK
jgi:hypothetical protein